MKILVAADGSTYTRRMLAYVAAHDDWLGPAHDYTVVHAVPAIPRRAAAALGRPVVEAYHRDSAESVFKPIRTFFGVHGIEARYVVRVGPAAAGIAKLAGSGRFELLVMGSHGHGSVAGLVLGSVATQVLAMCTTPVLLIR